MRCSWLSQGRGRTCLSSACLYIGWLLLPPPPCLPLSHSRVLANFREVLRMPFHFLPNHCLEPDFDGRAPPPMVLRQYQAVLDRSGGAELGIRGPVFRLQTPGVQGGHLHAPAKTHRINLNNMSFHPQHLPGWS